MMLIEQQFSRRNVVLTAFSIFVSIVMLGLSAYHLHYGIDFFDEALYVVYADRILEGARFLIDEYNISQYTGLLLTPFAYVYLLVTGSLTGIVLFSRYVYFFLSLLVGIGVARTSRLVVPPAFAVFVGLIPVIYTPFYIHNLSYNTVGSLGLTLGLFLWFAAIEYRRGYFWVGFVISIAAINYQPFGLIALLLIPLMRYFGARLIDIAAYCAGGAILLSLLLINLWLVGIAHLQTVAAFVHSIGVGGGHGKFLANLNDFWVMFHDKLVVGVLLLTAIFGRQRWPALGVVCSQLIFATVLYNGLLHQHDPMIYLRNIAFVGPLVAVISPANPMVRRVLWLLWLPSVIAGMLSAWASNNGSLNFIIGGLTASIATCLLIAQQFTVLDQISITAKGKKMIRAVMVLLFVLLLIMIVGVSDRHYGDRHTNELHAKITKGPFAGLYTTKERQQFCEQLTDDLASLRENASGILIYDDFPAGYLFTPIHGVTNSVWLFSPWRVTTFNRQMTVDYLQQRQAPDLVLRLTGVPDNPSPDRFTFRYAATDPIVQYTERRYVPIVKRQYYVIYRLGHAANIKNTS